MNEVGMNTHDLSVSSYDRMTASDLKKIQNNTYNFFRNIHKDSKSGDNMWTCFKSQKDSLKGNGYTKGHVAYNARATNDYRHKTTLAYLVNRFPRPPILRYFQTKGIQIDAERYALSELIQWIWRSQIRDGKPVDLYIPSRRMYTPVGNLFSGNIANRMEPIVNELHNITIDNHEDF